jgi:hypothetical protein
MTSRARWSANVTKHSNALDLDRSVFTWKDPRRIALSLKHSAEHSNRRKSDPYRSAMSMLTFYINRAGGNLSATRRRLLRRAKDELRRQFGREKEAATRRRTRVVGAAASRARREPAPRKRPLRCSGATRRLRAARSRFR